MKRSPAHNIIIAKIAESGANMDCEMSDSAWNEILASPEIAINRETFNKIRYDGFKSAEHDGKLWPF